MKLISAIFLLLLITQNSFAQKDSDRREILDVLSNQTDAWNKGDLEKFMAGYWQDDSLKFIGKSGITYGWQNTLDNYKKGYPDKDSRGKLRFEILSVEFLSKESAFVVGKFFLDRPKKGNASGYYTLLWKKIKGDWKIVVDHSS
jgi:ketosteroid isomerase-like protein